MADLILKISDMNKEFPGVVALSKMQLNVKRGKVHGLMGENGAGKSTLMKILIGIYQKTSGSMIWKGKETDFENTQEALSAGISMIHQELNLVPYLTVAENIWLGREPLKHGLIDFQSMFSSTDAMLSSLGIKDINATDEVGKLTIARQQLVEIVKATSYESELVIMDEPTSAITEKEVEYLFKIIEKLKNENKAILYISHKMDEIFKICDELTIMRDGEFIDTGNISDFSKEKVIKLMVGRELKNLFPKEETEIGEVILSVKNLSRSRYFQDVSFDLRKGEILGFAGLVGSGRTEIMESIFGVYPAEKGEIFVKGKKINFENPQEAIKEGFAFLTEDRKKNGLFLVLSVSQNIEIINIDSYIKNFIIDEKLAIEDIQNQIQNLRVKTPSEEQLIEKLSGGNQQKSLIARWLLIKPKILILDEPTRGIDVGSKSEIHSLISKLAKSGVAVILISSEMPEVLGMSDRVAVMFDGKLQGILDREQATQEKIMTLASGEKLT